MTSSEKTEHAIVAAEKWLRAQDLGWQEPRPTLSALVDKAMEVLVWKEAERRMRARKENNE
jgi:hypothetical protein